jgi:hypothetical protein
MAGADRDEGAFHGAAGSAHAADAVRRRALVACPMTQLRASSKRLRIEAGEITLRTRLHWRGRQRGCESYVTEPVAFSIDIEMEWAASVPDRLRLIKAAKKGCFVEQTLMRPNTIAHRLKDGERWVGA